MSEDLPDPSHKTDLETTRDGSHTLYSHRFNQHYHNPNGAVAESKHNFFKTNGLYTALKEKSEITILEVGFGTGLNLLLLLDALKDPALTSKPTIRYYSIEAYPIEKDVAASFNFGEHLMNPELSEQLVPIFSGLKKGLNHFDVITHLQATIFHGLFSSFPLKDLQADFIFHDAFSPDVNEELWTGETFTKLKELSTPGVILTTYSAASKAKGAMAWAGWKVAKAQGALGKREMTIAALDSKKLDDFERVNEKHLSERYEQGDF